jgi:FAD:protein FMN transferase
MKLVRLWIVVAAIASGCVSKPPEQPALTRFEYLRAEMGVPFRMVFYARDKMRADSDAAAAFQRIKEINDIMSDYDSDSELNRLSQTSGQGRDVRVSQDLWVVLQRAQELAQSSHGAFDMTVGPYVNLWRQARRTGVLPDPARMERARQSVGYQLVRLDPERHAVRLLGPEMRLDLGGIAKGYAVDQAIKVLAQRGIERALVAGGGDLAVSGPPPGNAGWRIEIASLDASNAPAPQFVRLAHAGISTSGDLFQRLDVDGKRYSHIVDPRTGMGLTDHSLVTVIAGDDITADSLTKVASVSSPEEAVKFIENTPGAAARIVRKPGDQIEVYESKGFRQYYEGR